MIVFVVFQAIETQTWWMLLIAAFLLYQVVVNKSCLGGGSGSCEIPGESSKKEE